MIYNEVLSDVLRYTCIVVNVYGLVMMLLCLPSWKAQNDQQKSMGFLVLGYIAASIYGSIEQMIVGIPSGIRTIPFIGLAVGGAIVFTSIYVQQRRYRSVLRGIRREADETQKGMNHDDTHA